MIDAEILRILRDATADLVDAIQERLLTPDEPASILLALCDAILQANSALGSPGVSDVQEDNGWIQTFTSRQFWPLEPKPEDVCIEDIAHHLAYTCRHGGRIRHFYSTAQHCLDVADLVPPEYSLVALMHDAAEAYFADVARPVKHLIPMLREVEDRIHAAVCRRFGISPEIPPCVKRADLVMLATERRDLLGEPPAPWVSLERVEPRPRIIQPWPPEVAEKQFLVAFQCEMRNAESIR